MTRSVHRRIGTLASIVAAIATTSSVSRAAPAAPDNVMVGPWTIAADFQKSKFLGCAMSRTTPDDVEVTISRGTAGLSLTMTSAKWKLGRGKTYPVDLVAGNLDEKAEVSASGDTVSLNLKDAEFVGKLAQENELDVKGAGSTIKVALDASAAALDRLNSCYDKNAKPSTDANPFVAPKQKP